MSVRTYNDGRIVEEWDDESGCYRRHNKDGELVEEREYTTAEAEPIEQRRYADECDEARATLVAQLADGVADIQAARAAAVQDKPHAEELHRQALDAKASTANQRTSVAAFTPAATYSAAQLGQVRNAITDVLARVEEIQQALADYYAHRAKVDANAILTDDALLWLARLASDVLEVEPPPQ